MAIGELDELISVLVVINPIIKRKGLSHLLNAQPGIAVAGEASGSGEGLRMARESKPDVILLGQNQFDSDGPDFIQRVWQDAPQTNIVVLAGDGQKQIRLDNQAGSLNFAQSDTSPEMLADLMLQLSKNGSRVIEDSLSRPNG